MGSLQNNDVQNMQPLQRSRVDELGFAKLIVDECAVIRYRDIAFILCLLLMFFFNRFDFGAYAVCVLNLRQRGVSEAITVRLTNSCGTWALSKCSITWEIERLVNNYQLSRMPARLSQNRVPLHQPCRCVRLHTTGIFDETLARSKENIKPSY